MGERGKTEAMEGQRDRAKESKTERMEKEWRNAMRHCVAVKKHPGAVAAKRSETYLLNCT